MARTKNVVKTSYLIRNRSFARLGLFCMIFSFVGSPSVGQPSDPSSNAALENFRVLFPGADTGSFEAMSLDLQYYTIGAALLMDEGGFDEATSMGLDWLALSAIEGSLDALWLLGSFQLWGSVEPDYAAAREYFERAAASGHVESQSSLGDIFADGAGVPQDYAQAAHWYTLAAERGYAYAQYQLSIFYITGLGVEENESKGGELMRSAAIGGHADAQFQLGELYASGLGVLQDFVYAHMWYNIAASKGREDASEKRQSISRLMTAAQIEDAQELARNCLNSNYMEC